MKKRSKILIVGAFAAALMLIGIVAVIFASGGGKNKYDTQLEMAQKYLDELNYEQAIVELRLAIDIEPDNSEAYFVLSEVYVAMEDYESAITVLEEGYAAARDAELLEKREIVARELESMLVKAVSSPELMSEPEEDENFNDEAEGEENGDGETQEPVDTSVLETEYTPEETAWVDDLYNKMIEGDYEAVFEIISEPDFIEKCNTFEYEKRDKGEYYDLLTSDGEIVWARSDSFGDIGVAYSYHARKTSLGRLVFGDDYYYELLGEDKGMTCKSWLCDQIYHFYSLSLDLGESNESKEEVSADKIVVYF